MRSSEERTAGADGRAGGAAAATAAGGDDSTARGGVGVCGGGSDARGGVVVAGGSGSRGAGAIAGGSGARATSTGGGGGAATATRHSCVAVAPVSLRTVARTRREPGDGARSAKLSPSPAGVPSTSHVVRRRSLRVA